MRITTLLVVCSLPACVAPVGEREHQFGADAGVDGSSANGPCEDLVVVKQDLAISGSSGFADLPTTCWKLAGKLTLTGPAVTSVDKLGDLRAVTSLELDDTDLTRFDSKKQIDVTGDIYIHHNDRLTDIANVTAGTPAASIRVEYNTALTGLGGLSRATVVAGETRITSNPKLAAADLGSAQRLEGGLVVQDNGALASLTLSSLQSVGSLTFARNAVLASVGSMSSMTNVHGTLTIDDNDALTSLGAFGSALVVDSGIAITNNAKLADVGQLARASRVFGAVQLTNNSALDPTKAHDIGCCVQTGAFTSSNNSNTQCTGNHWCLTTQDACYR